MKNKIVLITGGSSGIGLAVAKHLADKGAVVYEISRRDIQTERVYHIGADITDEEAVRNAIQKIVEKEGHIDVLINNAGYGISGAVEFTQTQEAEKLFQVDFFGAVRVTKAVLPIMRRAGQGRIVNIGSVAGRIPIPFQAYYSSAKAAIGAYTAALDAEVCPFGIRAVSVLPGDIQTGFTAAREKWHDGDLQYDGRISRSVAKMEHDEQQGMTPEFAARVIAKAAFSAHPKPSYAVGGMYGFFLFLQKVLPERMVAAIVRAMYG